MSTTDILPGVLDFLDLPPLARSDGESLKRFIDGTSVAAQPAFGETDYPLSFGWAPLRSVRAEGFKFIEAPRPEFYDLHADPGELHSTYQPWNADVQKLREKLAAERKKYPEHSAGKAGGAVGTATTQELEALGYLGPADASSSSTVSEPSLLPDPKDKIAEQNLLHTAMLAIDDGRMDAARAAFEKVLEENPGSPEALSQLGQLELSAANYSKAAGYFGRARALRPDDANLALHLGEALSKSGEAQAAEQAFQASLKLNPHEYAARFMLGSFYFSRKEFSAARDQLEAALLIQTTFEAQIELAKVQLAQRKFEEARQQLEAAIKIRGDSAEAYDLLARAYTGLGKKGKRAESAGPGEDSIEPEIRAARMNAMRRRTMKIYLEDVETILLPLVSNISESTRPRICLGCSMP